MMGTVCGLFCFGYFGGPALTPRKKVGDFCAKGEILAVIETDKVSTEAQQLSKLGVTPIPSGSKVPKHRV